MQNLKQILIDIGHANISETKTHYHTNALYRGGDNFTALEVCKKSGKFYDFVERKGGSLSTLIKITLDVDEKGLEEFCKTRNVEIEEDFEHQNKVIISEKIWSKEELKGIFPHYKFYEDRGISKETLEFFKSGFVQKGPMYGRYVFPIINRRGQIHGWSGRDITQRWKETGIKWKHLGSKKNWIYPVFVGSDKGTFPCLEFIQESSEVILVESIGDMIKLWEFGKKNVIVTFGLSVSSKIASFLMSLNLERIVIATNNDYKKEKNRGKIAAMKIFLQLMHYFDAEKIQISLPPSEDFGEITKDQFLEWNTNLPHVNKETVYLDILSYLGQLYNTVDKRGKRKITKTEIKFGKKIQTLHESKSNS